eukprot:1926182-Rhodomonas_salina.1
MGGNFLAIEMKVAWLGWAVCQVAVPALQQSISDFGDLLGYRVAGFGRIAVDSVVSLSARTPTLTECEGSCQFLFVPVALLQYFGFQEF